MRKVRRAPTTPKKICPQCQDYLETHKFSPNVYTEDGLNILCDACYRKATENFAAEKPVVPTDQTRAAFAVFVDFQNRIKGR